MNEIFAQQMRQDRTVELTEWENEKWQSEQNRFKLSTRL
jgi:hypothetical protein